MVKFKIVLYGDSGVGKTTMLFRLVKKEFIPSNYSTIGASFITWKPEKSNPNNLVLGIWDTAGQERFNSLIPMYLRGSHVVIYCVDYNEPFDATKATKMYDTARDYSPECLFYLVFTKIDMCKDTITPKEGLNEFIKNKDIIRTTYTSSLTGQGVDELFQDITEHVKQLQNDNIHVLQVEKSSNQKNKNPCCL